MIQLSGRITDAIAVPANDATRGRRSRWTGPRIGVDAPDEEEEEDENEIRCDVVGEEIDKPVKSKPRHHTGVIPKLKKGDAGCVGCDFVYPRVG